MYLTLPPVALVLLFLAAPRRWLIHKLYLDLPTVPCDWRGDVDGKWLYMSTSTLALNRAAIMSSNFTNQGGVYEDGISCDPALFFLVSNLQRLTNVTLFTNLYQLLEISYEYENGVENRIPDNPYDVTMLNLTFSKPSSRHFPLQLRYLQSPALRDVSPDLDYRLSRLQVDLADLLILDLSFNGMKKLDRDIFDGMRNLTVLLLKGNHFFSISEHSFCGESLPMLYSVNLIDWLGHLQSSFRSPEPECSVFNECDMTDLGLLRLPTSFYGLNVRLQSFTFSRMKGAKELQVSGSRVEMIADDTFACLTEMKNLFLSNNKIQKLSNRTFSHLDNLHQLLLNNNILSNIYPRRYSNRIPVWYISMLPTTGW